MATPISSPPPAVVDRSEFGGLRLLLSDITTASLLLGRARLQLLARVFGVRADQSTMVTLIVGMMLARSVQEKAARARAGVGRPSLGEAAVGGGVVKEGLHLIAGPRSREVPLGSLVTIVVVVRLSRPVIRRSGHAVRTGSHRAHQILVHRYGHLIGLNGRQHVNGRQPHLSDKSLPVPAAQSS